MAVISMKIKSLFLTSLIPSISPLYPWQGKGHSTLLMTVAVFRFIAAIFMLLGVAVIDFAIVNAVKSQLVLDRNPFF